MEQEGRADVRRQGATCAVGVRVNLEQTLGSRGYHNMESKAAAVIAIDESELVRKHEALIRSLASKFCFLDRDDLCQIGRLALVEASRKWSPNRGVQIWTYARRSVVGAMIDAVSKEVARIKHEHGSELDAESFPEELNFSLDDKLTLKTLLSILSDAEVEILRLHIVEDLDFRSIASRTDRSVGDVFRIYERALSTLRERAS
jgi:RNA polymerase sigma factor (sigma-70 family)